MGSSQKLLPPSPALSYEPFVKGNLVFDTTSHCFYFSGSGDCELQFSGFIELASGVFSGVEVLNFAVPADSTGIGAVVGVQDRGFLFKV